jgi:hypothetical protein
MWLLRWSSASPEQEKHRTPTPSMLATSCASSIIQFSTFFHIAFLICGRLRFLRNKTKQYHNIVDFQRDREPRQSSSDTTVEVCSLILLSPVLVVCYTQHSTRKHPYGTWVNLYHQRSCSHAGGISPPQFSRHLILGSASHLRSFVICAWHAGSRIAGLSTLLHWQLRGLEVGMILYF